MSFLYLAFTCHHLALVYYVLLLSVYLCNAEYTYSSITLSVSVSQPSVKDKELRRCLLSPSNPFALPTFLSYLITILFVFVT